MTDDELKGKLIDLIGRIKVAEVVGHSIGEESFATEIIVLFREASWVELDEDQHTPTHYYPYDSPEYYQAQRDMIRDGWVKAKKEWGL